MASMRLSVGFFSSWSMFPMETLFAVRPCRPMESMRMAFWRTSSNVRPMAITSPTDFISEPISVETLRNFLRSQRGYLRTM